MRWKHLRFDRVEQKREVARRLGPFLALMLGLVLSACSDTPTSVEGARRTTGTTGIGGLTVYACQYGGFYPDCNLPPDAPIVVNPNPANQETQQQCNLLLDSCGGGGDGETGDVPPDTTACPHRTDGCQQPLTDSDTVALRNAMGRVKTVFSDSASAAICETLKRRFEEAFAAGKVFRGDTAMPEPPPLHAAQTVTGGTIHIDGEYLSGAADPSHPAYEWYQKSLAAIALHEAAHWTGYPPHGEAETWNAFTTFPYNYATGGPGAAEQCV